MVQPRAVMHSPNGRIVALRGDRGRAHVPAKALENGRFEGNVVVSVWMPDDQGRSRDITTDEPSVVVLAREATFDAIRNRIDAPGEVQITSDTLQFTGETLELVLSADFAALCGGRLESLGRHALRGVAAPVEAFACAPG